MATLLVQKREELAEKQKALATIFEEAGEDLDLSKVKTIDGDTRAKAAEIKRRNDELTALGREVDELVDLDEMAKKIKAAEAEMARPANPLIHPTAGAILPVRKSLGELFVESKAFTEFKGRQGPSVHVPDVDLKVLMSTAAGWAPESLRTGKVIMDEQQTPKLIDIIPMTTTGQAAVVYMEETTFTNNAAERAEGANNAGEAALVLTQQTSTVREIAVWIPVTQEQMEDVSQVQGYVNNRLTLMCRQRLNSQILVGNGVAPNLLGILQNGNILTQAKGADPTPDAVYKAMTQVRVAGAAEPSAVVFHPNDWQDIRLLRTVDGVYIWGSPADAGPERIWGLTVVQETAETENTGLVGDFRTYCELAMRRGIQFEVTDSHASLFIQRTLAILASLRAAFIIYRPTAFCQVTGI